MHRGTRRYSVVLLPHYVQPPSADARVFVLCFFRSEFEGVVTIEEFCADGGLRDTLRANFNFGGYT